MLDTCAEQLRVSHVGDLGAASNMQGKEPTYRQQTVNISQNITELTERLK